MERETLITFNFTAPYGTRRVELLGSWDNFTHAYSMDQDRRRSSTHWTGCFRFNNIIYDGRSSSFTQPRNGGLRQGGIYWFFFRLDDSIEAYDDARTCKADCPLLPGQTVNFMEVPIEAEELVLRPRSDSGVAHLCNMTMSTSYQYTLDPATKYKPLSPSRGRRLTHSGRIGAWEAAARKEPVRRSDLSNEASPSSRKVHRNSSPMHHTQSRSISPVAGVENSSRASRTSDPLSRSSKTPSPVRSPGQQSIAVSPRSSSLYQSRQTEAIRNEAEHQTRTTPIAVSEGLKKLDISSAKILTMWKTSNKPQSHHRLNGDKCYQVSIPQDYCWAQPSLPESMQALRGSLVT